MARTTVDIPGSGRTTYGWDWVANRTTPTAVYNDADQLTSFGGSSYTYNATGVATHIAYARGAKRHMPAVRRTARPAARRAACPRAAGALMASGVFTQRDPVLDGVNWYAYVSGGVMTAVDPSGMQIGVPGVPPVSGVRPAPKCAPLVTFHLVLQHIALL